MTNGKAFRRETGFPLVKQPGPLRNSTTESGFNAIFVLISPSQGYGFAPDRDL